MLVSLGNYMFGEKYTVEVLSNNFFFFSYYDESFSFQISRFALSPAKTPSKTTAEKAVGSFSSPSEDGSKQIEGSCLVSIFFKRNLHRNLLHCLSTRHLVYDLQEFFTDQSNTKDVSKETQPVIEVSAFIKVRLEFTVSNRVWRFFL